MTEGKCMDQEETEEFLKAYDQLLNILGIDDEIDSIIINAKDPQGNPYKLIIKWNEGKMCWEAKVID